MTPAHTAEAHQTTRERLAELGLALPSGPAPAASYAPAVRAGETVFTSGQLPLRDGELQVTGKVGANVTAEQAADLAVLCTVNALAAASRLGDLDRARIVKMTGFVASAPGFNGQPAVMNVASALLRQAFGENGEHARSAVGVAELPLDAPVEVELVIVFS